MTHAQELTLAIATLLQLDTTSPKWLSAYERVGKLRSALVEATKPTEVLEMSYAEYAAHTESPEFKREPQPKPPTDDEQKQVVAAVIAEKAFDEFNTKLAEAQTKELNAMPCMQPKPVKPEKAATAKAGGVKAKEKVIVDMSAAELKALAKKHDVDFSTVNFRKADEKDAFRSKLAKVLGRSSELNYSVKATVK